MQLEVVDAIGDAGARARQKARAHAIGSVAEPKVETCGLNLSGNELLCRQDPAGVGERGDHAVGQDAMVIGAGGERQGGLSR